MISIMGICFCRQKKRIRLTFQGAKLRGRCAVKFVTDILKPDVQTKYKLFNNKMSIKIVSALSGDNSKNTVISIKFCTAYNVFLLVKLI